VVADALGATARGTLHQDVNVTSPGGWPSDYCVPDLVLLTRDCSAVDRDICFEGPPTVVVEIRSPSDNSMEKLPFYARLGVPEVSLIDRDARRPEVLALRDGQYETQTPAADGWLDSAATGTRLRSDVGNSLAMQLAADETSRRVLPEA
jgi:Uma2 family endonuclease